MSAASANQPLEQKLHHGLLYRYSAALVGYAPREPQYKWPVGASLRAKGTHGGNPAGFASKLAPTE